MKVLVPVVAVALFLVSFSGNAEENKLIAAGTAAPSFSLPSLSGDRVSLSAWCGEALSKPYVNKVRHTVILSFWATYCKPCQKEIPQLQAFSEKHKGENVIVLCVSIDKEGADLVAPFVKDKGYAVQVLLDPYAKTSARYGVSSLPALFVIDTLGIVRYASRGYDEKIALVSKLDKVVRAIYDGTRIPLADDGGAAVPVDTVTHNEILAPGNAAHPTRLTPKQRWNAIARVECGEPIEKVASSVGATPSELHTWYNDLKKAATAMWAADTLAR